MANLNSEQEQNQGPGDEERVELATLALYKGIRNGSVTPAQLQDFVDRDALVEGFFNIRYLERKLRQYLEAGVTGVLLAEDVDDFKRFNDSEGHPAGDELLKLAGSVMRQQTRSEEPTPEQAERRSKRIEQKDLLVRAGGDEFIIFLVGAEMPDAIKAAKRIRTAIVSEVRKLFPDYGPEQTMSLGLSQNKEGDTVSSLRQRADQALYLAKAGRGKGIVEESIAIR